MKISKIKIRNLFGIKEFDATGKDIELAGKNGVGKTSVIDAIKLALTNRSQRQFVLLEGETEGEILIQTDSGLTIQRKIREGKADYKSIKQDGERVEKTEAFLRTIFTELQLNPIEFASMDEKEQNRIILDLIDFKWDVNWIKEQFGEIVPDVNYQQNILCVLHDIQAEDGFYFRKRQDINREAKTKKAFVDEIGQKLPANYSASTWEEFNLGEVYKKIEAIRNNNAQIERAKSIVKGRADKIRGFQADLDISNNAIERETSGTRQRLEKEVMEYEAKIKQAKAELASLEEKKQDKLAVAKKTFEAAVAGIEGEAKQFETLASEEPVQFNELQEQADTAEKMKAYIREYNSMVEMQEQLITLNSQSEELTAKIEKARLLPGQILETCKIPIEGLTIKDGIPLINGLPVSNLSEGEKFELCVSITTKNDKSLQLILMDGIERLASEKRDKVYSDLKAKGVQFIASRTSDDESLTVVEL